MVTNEEIKRTPQNPKNRSTQAVSNQVTSQNRGDSLNNGEINQRRNDMFSPTFKSVAELAGWDEEALLLASLVVEDTPEREKDASNKKKRSRLILKTPPSNSRRTRRAQKRSPEVIPVSVLNLDDDDDDDSRGKGGEIEMQKKEVSEAGRNDAKKLEFEEDKPLAGQSFATSCSTLTIPDMDRLREELSCAICLEICFEPSTTPCGHSFCKKCLRSAADKCGKRCPKCRQLISNGRSCTVNTVLWNTVQLLFPKEVEARKAAGALNVREAKRQSPMSTGERARTGQQHHNRYRSVRHNVASRSGRGGDDDGFRGSTRRSGRGVVASQDGDAALALRLQREEFMVEYRGGRRTNDEQSRSSFSSARENLRAIASRAARLRNRPISS